MTTKVWVERWLLPLSLTAILAGYLAVWLPGPVAALRLTGLELGEWIKFLPQVRSGQAPVSRNIFYLPPIGLGLVMLALSWGWREKRVQTWLLRGLALLVAALATPQLEVIRDEPAVEWRLRLGLVAAVGLVACLSPVFGRWRVLRHAVWLVTGLAMAYWPTAAYIAMRPIVAAALGVDRIGLGVGVWLNWLGFVGVALSGAVMLARDRPRLDTVNANKPLTDEQREA